jgi:hypothetical protein
MLSSSMMWWYIFLVLPILRTDGPFLGNALPLHTALFVRPCRLEKSCCALPWTAMQWFLSDTDTFCENISYWSYFSSYFPFTLSDLFNFLPERRLVEFWHLHGLLGGRVEGPACADQKGSTQQNKFRFLSILCTNSHYYLMLTSSKMWWSIFILLPFLGTDGLIKAITDTFFESGLCFSQYYQFFAAMVI